MHLSKSIKLRKIQIKMLKMSLQTYRLDVGSYPASLEHLNTAPSDAAELWNGPYLGEDLPNDAWDTPYNYQKDASAPQGFTLYSYGADKMAGGEGVNADVGYLPGT